MSDEALEASIDQPDAIRSALRDADLRVLLMCLFHLTGDRKWISAPYLPRRDVRLIADTQAGFSDDIADEIRTSVFELVAPSAAKRLRPPVSIEDPGPELTSEMLNACLGEVVPSEYVPMMRCDMGFAPVEAEWTSTASNTAKSTKKILIVGAGLSGLGLAYHLKRLGVPFEVVEKNPEVGGTWFENRYPGCGVDTPNHFYSYSFAPNHGWKHYFSPRNELQAYVESFATTSDLRPNIRFNTELIGAIWNDQTAQWACTLRSPTGETVMTVDVLVSAIGHFNKPVRAHFEGDDTFQGAIFHSAEWPDDLDLNGKRVAVIGTGASSMQLVPTIAPNVRELTIYQRTAQWAREVPQLSEKVQPGTEWLLQHLPYYAEWNRFTLFWRYGDGLLRFLKKDPDWMDPDRSLNRINDRHRQEMTDYINRQLADRPDLLEKCIPTYPPYGKRILLDKGWFSALQRDNVDLVTAAIDHFDETGIVSADGTHRAFDVVVVATGFQVTDLAARLNIQGRSGVRLSDDWAPDNPRAYLGMTVPGFPNFFCMYGPNTNAGHGGSAIFLGECQTRFITKTLVKMVEEGIREIEVREIVRDEYNDRVDAEHETLVWTHTGMSTYYRNALGRVVSPMPFRLVDYWQDTLAPRDSDFVWQ